MNTILLDVWLSSASLYLVGGVLLLTIALAALGGALLRTYWEKRRAAPDRAETQEGFIVSAVLGLLALMLGFTFSLAVDRYDVRRGRVLESANAIATAYFNAQLLSEPHRARLSNVLVRYTDNAIVLAEARPGQTEALLAKDDELINEILAATAAGFDSVRTIDFSTALVDSMNDIVEVDAARRAARAAHVPTEVFGVLFGYTVVAAGVLGYVLTGSRGRLSAGVLLVLTVVSLMLVLDIDRPTLGGMRESQGAMRDQLKKMSAQQPVVFDRWRQSAAPGP